MAPGCNPEPDVPYEGRLPGYPKDSIEIHTFKTRALIRVPLRLRFKEWRRRRRMSAEARRIEDEIGQKVLTVFLFGDAEQEYLRAEQMRDDAIDYEHDDR